MFQTRVIRVFLAIATSSILWCCSTPLTLTQRMHAVAKFMHQDIQVVEEQLASIQPVLDAEVQSPSAPQLRDRAQDLARRLAETEKRVDASLVATDSEQLHQALDELVTIQIEADWLVSETMLIER
jgi:hypothetical protein